MDDALCQYGSHMSIRTMYLYKDHAVRCHVPMQRRRHLVTVNFNRAHFEGETEKKKINFELCKKRPYM